MGMQRSISQIRNKCRCQGW